MSANDAVFGLFTNDKASEVFKKLGVISKNTAKETQSLSDHVELASKKALAANNVQLAATAKVQIAQQRLTELRAKGNVTSSAMMAAEEKLAAALRLESGAIETAEISTRKLNEAEARATFGAGNLSGGLLHAGGSAGFMESKFGRMVKTVAAGSAVFAGYELWKFGKQSVDAATAFEASQAKLQTAIKDSGHSFTQYAKPIEDISTKFRLLGFTDTETAQGLAVLTTSLKNPAKALSLMGTVADLARYKNLSLADSALIVAKGAEGQLRPIRALGIDIPVAAGGALKLANANAALAKAQANLASLGGVQVEMNKKQVKAANGVITAQTHLTDITNKYSNPATRTAAQTKAISAAQTVLTLEQQRTTSSANKYQKAQEAVYLAQEKVNAAASAGVKITEAISSAVKNQAVNAAQTWAVKQQALNAELDHMKVSVGTDLLPLLQDFAQWATKSGIPFMEHMISFAKDHGKEILGVLGAIAAAFITSKTITGIATFVKSIGLIRDAFVALRGVLVGVDIAEALATGGVSVGAGLAALGVAAATYGAFSVLTSGGSKGGSTSPSAKPGVAHKFDLGVPDFAGSSPKKLTTASSHPTIVVHQHIAGNVHSENKLIDLIHNGIAQNMKKQGIPTKTIGK